MVQSGILGYTGNVEHLVFMQRPVFYVNWFTFNTRVFLHVFDSLRVDVSYRKTIVLLYI